MASKNFSGTLDLPLGSKATRMKWRFTHQKTTGDVIAASPETTELTETGQYNFDLKFGQILIESKLPSQQNWFSHGSVVIDENTAISTLPELLVATSPVTEDVILQMQTILQDARDAEASSLEISIEAQDLLNETQGLISSFQSVEEIKKKATLSLDFTKNEHKTYEALGLESKPLTEILTTERATAGTYQSPFGLRTAEPNLPRLTYDEATGIPQGLLSELTSTNLFLDSEAPVNQSINTVAGAYTLSFWGGGEITLSGAASGSLAGGAERSSLTVTSSGGIVNLSISGDINSVQFELGGVATSYIQTADSQVVRSSDSHDFGSYADGFVVFVDVDLNVDGNDGASISHSPIIRPTGSTRGVGFATNAVASGNLRVYFVARASDDSVNLQVETGKTKSRFKGAFKVKNNSISAYIDGDLVAEAAGDFTSLLLGSRIVLQGGTLLSGVTSRRVNNVKLGYLMLFPQLSEDEIKELTR